MPISFLTTALLIVSVITNLTVEGIKKLLDGRRSSILLMFLRQFCPS
jgi:hypothetical protein